MEGQLAVGLGHVVSDVAGERLAVVGGGGHGEGECAGVGAAGVVDILHAGNSSRGAHARLDEEGAGDGLHVGDVVAQGGVGAHGVDAQGGHVLRAHGHRRRAEGPVDGAVGVVDVHGLTVLHIIKDVLGQEVHAGDLADGSDVAVGAVDASEVVGLVAGVVVFAQVDAQELAVGGGGDSHEALVGVEYAGDVGHSAGGGVDFHQAGVAVVAVEAVDAVVVSAVSEADGGSLAVVGQGGFTQQFEGRRVVDFPHGVDGLVVALVVVFVAIDFAIVVANAAAEHTAQVGSVEVDGVSTVVVRHVEQAVGRLGVGVEQRGCGSVVQLNAFAGEAAVVGVDSVEFEAITEVVAEVVAVVGAR